MVNIAMADRALLERVGQSLRVTTVDGHPNLTKSELRKVAATARALAASAEAEVEARPAPFPAELRPALVMQWLPLDEAAAAFSVSGSWREDAEQYFRRYAQREGIPRGDSWYASVGCDVWNSKFTVVQRRVFMYYAKHWARNTGPERVKNFLFRSKKSSPPFGPCLPSNARPPLRS